MGLCSVSMSSKWTLYCWASPYDLWSVASSAGFEHKNNLDKVLLGQINCSNYRLLGRNGNWVLYKAFLELSSNWHGYIGWTGRDLDGGTRVPLTAPPHDGLPTSQQQNSPGSHAVSPAVAGRMPPNHVAARPLTGVPSWQFCLLRLLLPSFFIAVL